MVLRGDAGKVPGRAGICRDGLLCGRFRFTRQARKLQTSQTLVREQVLSCGSSGKSDETLEQGRQTDTESWKEWGPPGRFWFGNYVSNELIIIAFNNAISTLFN
jgi:hypothetical protein